MPLKVHNTLTGQLEEFKPLHGNRVSMFVCGPTVYDYSHIGHARTYVAFDFIARYLRYSGYTVFYVMNLTDIDDKIIERGNERGIDPLQLSREFTQYFFEDMKALNITSINLYPKASEHVDEILRQIKVLVEKGVAYPMNESVYFEVNRFEGFGKLSRQDLDMLQAGARAERREEKLNPEDFALWKAYKPGEPFWDSPYGKGRPGWHIEDTAITITYFGEQYDLHGGARELIFPHHDSEIAIAESVTGKEPFVKYWLHAGLLNTGGEKMSKSLGNFWKIRDCLKHYPPEVLRFYFLHTHYRSPVDFDEDGLKEAKASYERLENTVASLRHASKDGSATGGDDLADQIAPAKERFIAAMDNDFNTREALAALFDFTRVANKALNEGVSAENAGKALALYEELGGILGIFESESRGKEDLLDDLVKMMIETREAARANKDYAAADKIRDDLKAIGIILEDKGGKTVWKRA